MKNDLNTMAMNEANTNKQLPLLLCFSLLLVFLNQYYAIMIVNESFDIFFE